MRKRRFPKWSKCLLLTVGVLAALVCAMLLAQTLVAHRPSSSFNPDYERLDLTALLRQETLSQADYDTLLLQTGLGRAAVDKLLTTGEVGQAAILQTQEMFFAEYEVVCDPLLGWFTREDHLEDDAGQTAFNPALVDLRPGDILLTLSTHSLGWRHGHAGLVVETQDGLAVLECVVLGTDSKVVSLDHWRIYSNCAVLRVSQADAAAQKTTADYALEHLLGIPYHLTAGFFGPKAPEPDSANFGLQCSYLVWYAWYKNGYDLDSDGGSLASSYDILHSDSVELVQIYGMDPRMFIDGSE